MAYLDFFYTFSSEGCNYCHLGTSITILHSVWCHLSFLLCRLQLIDMSHISIYWERIFLKKHLLSNQNEVCNDCSFPKNIGTKIILFFVVFVVGFGIYFGIYFGIDMLIIVLLNFLDKHVFLVPTCSGDFILVTTKILHSCIFVKLHNC